MNSLLLAPNLFTGEGGIARILRLYLKALCELASDRDHVMPSARLRRHAGPVGQQDPEILPPQQFLRFSPSRVSCRWYVVMLLHRL